MHIKCPTCDAINSDNSAYCFNCEHSLPEPINESGLSRTLSRVKGNLTGLFQLVGKLTLNVPAVYRNVRAAWRPSQTRCPLCGASRSNEICTLCEGFMDGSLLTEELNRSLTLYDNIPKWSVKLAALTLIVPTLVYLGTMLVLALLAFSEPAPQFLPSAVGIVLQILMFLLSLLFAATIIFNLFAYTSKKIIIDTETFLWGSSRGKKTTALSIIQLTLLTLFTYNFYLMTLDNSDVLVISILYTTLAAATVFFVIMPQIILLTMPLWVKRLRKKIGKHLLASLEAGYYKKVVNKYPVIGRPGGSLDTADLDENKVENGQQGEQKLAAAIAEVIRGKGILFNSVSVPKMKNADLDHIIMVGNSILIADSKNWIAATYHLEQGNVWRNGQPFQGGSSNLDAMRNALSQHLGVFIPARIVILTNQATIQGSRVLADDCILQIPNEFASEIREMINQPFEAPDPYIIERLIHLSPTANAYPGSFDYYLEEKDLILTDTPIR